MLDGRMLGGGILGGSCSVIVGWMAVGSAASLWFRLVIGPMMKSARVMLRTAADGAVTGAGAGAGRACAVLSFRRHDLLVTVVKGSSTVVVGSMVASLMGSARERTAMGAGAGSTGPSTFIPEKASREALVCLPSRTTDAHGLLVVVATGAVS